ncbi:MAG: aldehyde dehydrogenase EutE [Candidatus Sumerlaeota bacterium]|nr:aldehyde dehydrogenase EutE [Candidatus Sumerlaeota bacterium]
MSVQEQDIRTLVEEVLRRVQGASPAFAAPVETGVLIQPEPPMAAAADGGEDGVFDDVDQAVNAAERAQLRLMEMTLEQRGKIIQAIRETGLRYKEDFSQRTVEETCMGRFDDKVKKFISACTLTPGIEDLTTRAWTGDHGLTIEEAAPYGVIGAVTPSTHPLPTMINNAISVIAAGNSGVFNGHPGAKRVFAYGMQIFNRAIVAAGGPPNLICCMREPTMETGQKIFTHPKIRLLLVTGGPGVVKAAMAVPKKAICAGPGNPPVVVDETADLANAARCVFEGATFDNNILCIGEKEVFCVNSVFDQFKAELLKLPVVELNAQQIEALTRKAFCQKDGVGCAAPVLNRDFVGRNAEVLAAAIGLTVDPKVRLLIGETSADHLFVEEEQMMPFLPLVRCRHVDEAIDCALKAEHGYGHTAIMHSRNVANMSKMARLVNTTIFVKNGSSLAGVGGGGEGYGSYSIASPTGEGITSARTFTRQRRCVLVDYFRII